uniref:Uncharacterized protein n=1 Tax=Desertifilum tharense IPPAS B-1220 TaxID=1781255 RepID=A0ACD5GR38_9CYAN
MNGFPSNSVRVIAPDNANKPNPLFLKVVEVFFPIASPLVDVELFYLLSGLGV